jgi:hypothetical protein
MKKNKLPYRPDAGFKVPENYFQDFEAQMMRKVTAGDTLDNSYKGQSGFAVPAGLFQQTGGKYY